MFLGGQQGAAFCVQGVDELGEHRLGKDVGAVVGEDVVIELRPIEDARQGANIADAHAQAFSAGGIQLGGAEFAHHAAAIDDAVVAGEAAELVEDVAGDEHGEAVVAVEAQDQLAHFDDALGVEAVHGLVEDEKIGLTGQRHGDAEALLHAEGV